MYDAIISRHPQSPRACYGKASALNKMSEQKKSNAILEQAISEFLNVLSLPDVPKALAIKTAKTCAERQSFRGYFRRYHIHIKRSSHVSAFVLLSPVIVLTCYSLFLFTLILPVLFSLLCTYYF